MQAGRRNATALQLAHLVLHQGHQGRDHQNQPFTHHGRQLVAEGLPATGGQDRQAVLAGQQGLDHRPLTRPERGPAEVALQGSLKRFRPQTHHSPGVQRP